MGFLGTAASGLVDVNLLLQIIIYILIIGGVMSEKKGNFRRHGLIMGSAVTLGTVSLLLVMGPSLVRSFAGITGIGYGLGSPLTLIHAIIGTVGLVMGWTAVLALRPCGQVREKKGLGKVSRFMRIMVMVWTLVFVLGIAIYLYFYV